MKTTVFSLALLFAASAVLPGFQKDTDDKSVSQDLKDAGSNTKHAVKKGARKTKNGVEKGATKSTHAVKKGTHKAAAETEKGADTLRQKTSDTSPQK